MAARAELVDAVGVRYRGATRVERSRILDEFAAVTGYHRKHAIRLLADKGKRKEEPAASALPKSAPARRASTPSTPPMRQRDKTVGTGQTGGSVLDRNPVLTAYRISYIANFYSGPIYRECLTMAEPFPLAPALWAATAPPAPSTPPLGANRDADVSIVGGGFAGLSAALHLAEAGTEVMLLEAREPGWGASGRNGGQVIPGLKYDPDVLRAKFLGKAGERLVDFAGRTADTVLDLIAPHRMDVPQRRVG